MNEHDAAVRSARNSIATLNRLIASIGNDQSPRGHVIAAYRVARRAMRGGVTVDDARDILDSLHDALFPFLPGLFNDAVFAGIEQAANDLRLYGFRTPDVPPLAQTLSASAVQSVESALAAQREAVLGVVQSGLYGDEVIVGDGERVGLLSPGGIARSASQWAAILLVGAYTLTVQSAVPQDEFMRQAVAAIDERTTDCCLRVHGQVVGLDEDFRLTGTPRFADRMRNPPFHWYCRTVTALVRRRDMDDMLTREMRDAARAELRARATTGQKQVIHPAHARSRRS